MVGLWMVDDADGTWMKNGLMMIDGERIMINVEWMTMDDDG